MPKIVQSKGIVQHLQGPDSVNGMAFGSKGGKVLATQEAADFALYFRKIFSETVESTCVNPIPLEDEFDLSTSKTIEQNEKEDTIDKDENSTGSTNISHEFISTIDCESDSDEVPHRTLSKYFPMNNEISCKGNSFFFIGPSQKEVLFTLSAYFFHFFILCGLQKAISKYYQVLNVLSVYWLWI
ncbi:hypothetical protein GHT06_008893 [Daphnia sinensis]|uniref:Uncharacterized protein n=1 Tax=Daphnia sinensis TaxID=1820382 RepID=A0AAD5Q2N7_9CRUS|nr:hypothetical protein GHT06_008893 [Daphnia sinensis]